MVWMEKQLESLTELVKELTRERTINEQQQSMTRSTIHKGMIKIRERKKVYINFYNMSE